MTISAVAAIGGGPPAKAGVARGEETRCWQGSDHDRSRRRGRFRWVAGGCLGRRQKLLTPLPRIDQTNELKLVSKRLQICKLLKIPQYWSKGCVFLAESSHGGENTQPIRPILWVLRLSITRTRYNRSHQFQPLPRTLNLSIPTQMKMQISPILSLISPGRVHKMPL